MAVSFKGKLFKEINPDGAAMLRPELNPELDIDTLLATSKKQGTFCCLNNPKHVFKKRICKMTSPRDGHNCGCKYCGPYRSEPFPGENDLFTEVPIAKEMWDYSKEENIKYDPTKLFATSNHKVYFICKKGHSELRKILDFKNSPECPTCKKYYIYQDEQLLTFWNENRNAKDGIDPYKITLANKDNIHLSCPNCQYRWQWRTTLWSERRYCPHCGFDGSEGSAEKNRDMVQELFHIQTLADVNPIAARTWDKEANGDIIPEEVKAKANTLYSFICTAKGHHYKNRLDYMYDKKGNPREACPQCSEEQKMEKKSAARSAIRILLPSMVRQRTSQIVEKQPSSKFNVSVASNPYLMKFWDKERNTVDPTMVSTFDSREAFWRCKTCNYGWIQTIQNRNTAKRGKCPCHEMQRVTSDDVYPGYFHSFGELNPRIAPFFNDELNNGITPYKVARLSTQPVYLNCPTNPNHPPFLIVVNAIPSNPPFGCPICTQQASDLYNLMIQVPISVDMWDSSNELNLADARTYMSESAKFVCEKGHHFSRAIRTFVKDQSCPFCMLDSVAKHPEMMRFWDVSKNIKQNPNLLSVHASEHANWLCQKCGYSWNTEINTRFISRGTCPCCEEKVVFQSGVNDLLSLLPQAALDILPEDNPNLNLSSIPIRNDVFINWDCHMCHYKWVTSSNGRTAKDSNKNYRLRTCPVCAGVRRTANYYIEHYPEVFADYNEEENGKPFSAIDDTEIKDLFWWNCRNEDCLETYQATIQQKISTRNSFSKGCLYCAGKKVLREKSFAALHPDMIEEYDSRNLLDPFEVTEHSTRTVSWVCRNNPEHTWQANFYERASGYKRCPVCDPHPKYKVMLYEMYPEFEKYYSKENRRSFKSYALQSNEKPLWTCDNGHTYPNSIYRISQRGFFYCPLCEGSIVVAEINSVTAKRKDIVDQWSCKNDFLPEEVYYNTTSPVLWECTTCSGTYAFPVSDKREGNVSCPYCNGRRVLSGFNEIPSWLITEYSLKNEVPISEYPVNSVHKVLWTCPTCHGDYLYRICDREIGDDSCPYCRHKKILVGFNSLADTDPDLAKEWSSGNSDLPSEYMKSSTHRALWTCPTCHGNYFYRICDRELDDDSCPYCRNLKVLPGFNSLPDLAPELVNEWSSENPDLPSEYTRSSTHRALWTCPSCHGDYFYRICDREVDDDSCPYCCDKKILPGYNSFKVRHPEEMEEWDELANFLLVDPNYILSSYNKAVWWICSKGHKYSMSPNLKLYYRIRTQEPCPFCKGRRRKLRHFY
ncbi:MAG: zinc-ribbon domain-containing protein [Lachnospiraceae bacterium]